jgi:hypothetical protein
MSATRSQLLAAVRAAHARMTLTLLYARGLAAVLVNHAADE